MSDMNKFITTGNMVAPPNVGETKNGKPVTRFRIAYTRGYGDYEKTSFVSCQAYGKTGEYIAKYGDKGRRVLIDSELDVLNTKEGDDWKTSVYATINSLQFLDSKRDASDSSNSREDKLPAGYSNADTDDLDDEDIPF